MKNVSWAGVVVGAVCLSGCCRCYATELKTPQAVKEFDQAAKTTLHDLAAYQDNGDQSYILKDNKGKKLGVLYLDLTPKKNRTIGYAGPVNTAVIVDNNNKISAVLVGNNQETPGFLNRVKRNGLLNKWNGKTLKEAASLQVDGVTGATLSSNAIKSGVKAISADRSGIKNVKTPQQIKAERTALMKRVRDLHMGLRFINKYLKQWEERTPEELEVRFIMATQGMEKGMALAKSKNLRIFKRGRNGFADPQVAQLAEAYKKAPTAANKKALEAAILKDFESLKVKMREHKAELRKSLMAIGKQTKFNHKMSSRKRGMKFGSPQAQALENKIVTLAAQYNKKPSPELEKQLRSALAEQLDLGIKVMGKAIAKKEKELQVLKSHYQRIGANKEAAINSRIKNLINK